MDDPQVVLLDYWFTNNQTFLYSTNLFPFKVKNLYKMPLNLTTIPTYLPYVMLDDGEVIVYPNKEPKLRADGIEIRIYREYCNRYNITLNISIDENLWGDVYDNHSGSAMFGSLLNDKIDAICGSMGTWMKPWFYLDYSYPYVATKITCLVPLPRLKDKFELLILPFSEHLWAALLFSTIFLTIAFDCVARVTELINREDRFGESTFNDQESSETKSKIVFLKIKFKQIICDFCESFYIVYGITFSQPIPASTQCSNDAFRNILTWILLQTLLITSVYSSGLSSIMTLPQYDTPIKTQQNLIDSKIEWGANDATWIESIAHSTRPKTIELLKTYKTYSAEQLRNPIPDAYGYLIESLIGGTFSLPEYASEEAVLKSQIMEEEIYWEHIRSTLRKSSPFLPAFNKLISYLQESGILIAFQKQVSLKFIKLSTQLHIQRGGMQNPTENQTPVALSIYDLESIFAIWCVGIIISSIFFGFEKYLAFKENKLQF